MAITVIDLSSALWNWLQTHDKAAKTRALVQGGATNILEAGDVNPDILTAAFDARKTAGADNLVLGISVQDAGEERDYNDPYRFIQEAIIRIYDRLRGYRNIRNVRAQLREDMGDVVLALTSVDGRERGALDTHYVSRTGHIRDRAFVADWEGIVVRSIVILDELN